MRNPESERIQTDPELRPITPNSRGVRVAAIRKVGDRWRAEVRKRGVYASESFRTKAEATKWALEQESAIEDGRVGKVPRKSLADAFDRYKLDVTPLKRGWRPETLRINKFLATIPFVNKPLTEITSDDWATWRDSVARGSADRKALAPGSIRRDFNIIRAMYGLALDEWGWIKVNPLKKVKSPESPAGKDRVIAPAEVTALCEAFGYFGGKPTTQCQRVAAGMLFALETGMRAGEVFSLKPSDVHEAKRTAHLPMTKNGTARTVPLSRRALELVKLSATKEKVFDVTPDTASSLFRKYRPKDLADISFHATRHTAATRLGSSGKLTPFELCAMFGWTDMKMALRYFHATASDMAAKLD